MHERQMSLTRLEHLQALCIAARSLRGRRERGRRDLDSVTSVLSMELIGGRVSEANSSGVFLYVAFMLSPQAYESPRVVWKSEGKVRTLP